MGHPEKRADLAARQWRGHYVSGHLDILPQTKALHPWLLSDHWLSFSDLLHTHIAWSGIVKNVAVRAGYIAVFGAAAWARFTTKDIMA
jgi:ABC-2 type transport system permease protein